MKRCFAAIPAAILLIPIMLEAMPMHEETYKRLRQELGPGAEIVADFAVPTFSARTRNTPRPPSGDSYNQSESQGNNTRNTPRNTPLNTLRNTSRNTSLNTSLNTPYDYSEGSTFLQSAMMPDLVTGTKHPCVACIKYPDYANTYTRSNFQNMLFGTWSSGSALTYYSEVSYDNITLAGTVFPDSTSWYTADNNRSYYGFSNGFQRAAILAKESAQKADANINYADFDDNGDGEVDMYTVIHSGYGREESGSGSDIHSHSWSFSDAGIGAYTSADPWPGHPGQYITVDAYTIDPERSNYSNNGSMVCIGVFCHEWGHAFGLPDLYSTTGQGNGLGNWSLMASGSWGGDGSSPWKPAHLDGWSKSDLGWLAFRNVDHNGIRNVYAAEDSAVAYRVWTEGSSSSQFFLVENRQKRGFDTTLVRAGLLIYHVDSALIHSRRFDNDVQKYSPYGIDLEDADGLNHIYLGDNRGDAGDPYPGSANNTAFDSLGTAPDSRNHALENTRCGVNTISSSALAMTAFFYIGPQTQPDNLIKNSDVTQYVGDSIYESVPSDSQTVSESTPPGVAAVYHIKIENDGEIQESYLVTGPGDTATENADWIIKYYDAYSGGTDITSDVTGAGWSTDHIGPGDSLRIRVEVTPDFSAGLDESLDVVVTTSTAGYSEESLDAVKASTTVGEHYQPDALVKNLGESVYLGDDIYNTTGTNQTSTQNPYAGETAVYHARIESDYEGNGEQDVIRITGTQGNADWTVRYFDALTGGAEITSMVTDTGWCTTPLGTSQFDEIRAEVTADSGLAPGTLYEVLVTATSSMDTSRADVIKARTTVAERPGLAEDASARIAFEAQGNRVELFLPASTTLSLFLYDPSGRMVCELASGTLSPGLHELTWQAPRGVYFLRLKTPSFTQVRKVVRVSLY